MNQPYTKPLVAIAFVLLATISNASAQSKITEKYFRHLMYNHVSPHVPIRGIYEIDKLEAQKTSHYIFKYDKSNRLVEIINNHYHTERRHPLTTIGAYRTVFNYKDHKETRTYFDKNGNRIANDRNVYKEEYLFDKKRFKYALKFYDLEDKPMESEWGIARYEWSRGKKFVIERRFNLNNEMVNVSPYFEFGITGILYDKAGFPKGHFNLTGNLEIQENSAGVASYQDTYDENGNHVLYTYHNKHDELVKNQWGFAIGKKDYDQNGNFIARSTFDENNNLIDERVVPSNAHIQLASPATEQDSLEIRQKSLGYLVALQELRPQLMENVFHPDLAKRTIGFDPREKKENIRETTYQQMIEYAKSWNKAGNRFPPKPYNQVVILDIYHRIATVKLISDNWVEHLHLVKTNHEWKIINLLWQFKDVNMYPD
ncbi:nuclear transport factor 2 family protein [Fulvivirgaceae bacterium BMA10]|uniref:Nuclear transport factor 2 family protein n=1 Tax=Splendidivirga corallicola TaxID=3051826 RepID=A0ABT8KW19_9BACT|nr:nuclear transport factor 2 family protein [Fulvivirgaceae bacterium BMA10]